MWVVALEIAVYVRVFSSTNRSSSGSSNNSCKDIKVAMILVLFTLNLLWNYSKLLY